MFENLELASILSKLNWKMRFKTRDLGEDPLFGSVWVSYLVSGLLYMPSPKGNDGFIAPRKQLLMTGCLIVFSVAVDNLGSDAEQVISSIVAATCRESKIDTADCDNQEQEISRDSSNHGQIEVDLDTSIVGPCRPFNFSDGRPW